MKALPPGLVDTDTGEVLEVTLCHNGASVTLTASQARWRLYALQDRSRALLGPVEATPGGRSFRPRVRWCRRLVLPTASHVRVLRTEDRAHYGNLAICGSVWHCPVCAARVMRRRGESLSRAIEDWRSQGGAVELVTYTVPHGWGDTLAATLAPLTKAKHTFHTSRRVRDAHKAAGFLGYCAALELTHGRNGWHPHYHELWFHRGDYPHLGREWANACELRGLPRPDESFGWDRRGAERAAHYVSKELTHSLGKSGRSEHSRTPWQLLEAAASEPEAADLWTEYCRALYGKRQLQSSRGFAAYWNEIQVTDEELAVEQTESSVLLGLLTREEWAAVLESGKRSVVLDLAERQWEAVQRLLRSLPKSQAGRSPHR